MREQDAYEFSSTPDQLTTLSMTGIAGADDSKIVEVKPMFHEYVSNMHVLFQLYIIDMRTLPKTRTHVTVFICL